jgi:hypothetical protein
MKLHRPLIDPPTGVNDRRCCSRICLRSDSAHYSKFAFVGAETMAMPRMATLLWSAMDGSIVLKQSLSDRQILPEEPAPVRDHALS